MSIECGECEHDLRGGHARDCSRWQLLVCPNCYGQLQEGDGYMFCAKHGEVEPLALVRTLPAATDAVAEALREAAEMIDKRHRGSLPDHIKSEDGNAIRAMIEAKAWKGPGEKPHAYSPDYMAMGDCSVCGHTRDAHD